MDDLQERSYKKQKSSAEVINAKMSKSHGNQTFFLCGQTLI